MCILHGMEFRGFSKPEACAGSSMMYTWHLCLLPNPNSRWNIRCNAVITVVVAAAAWAVVGTTGRSANGERGFGVLNLKLNLN